MKMRSYLFLAALAASLICRQPDGHAFTHVDLDPGFVSEVETIFNVAHDRTAFDLDLVADEDPNLRLFQEAEIYITFIHERAGYKNQFGYFTFDDTNADGLISPDEIIEQELIFEDVSEDDGSLSEGDTVKIGPFPAHTQIGFYIVANGFVSPKGTYYTLNELNSDGSPHMAMVATSDGGNVAIGIEDKAWGESDLDFNDVIFTFTTTPDDALDEIIEDSNIPVNEDPAGEEETPEENPTEEIDESPMPSEEPITLPELPKVDGFDADGSIAVDEVGSAASGSLPAWYFEGSGNMGCSLSSTAVDETFDLAPWALFIAALIIFPLRRVKK